MDINLNNVQHEPIVVSASLTAALNRYYVNTASATYTDPTPVQGEGFIVYVKNGTATIGGTGYSTVGTIVYRYYHSGAWGNTVVSDPSGAYQPLDADLTSIASLSSTSAYLRRSAANTYVLDSYSTVGTNIPATSVTAKLLTGGVFAGTLYDANATIMEALELIEQWGLFLNYTSIGPGNIIVGDASGVAQNATMSLDANGGTFGLSDTGILTMPNADASTRGLLTAADYQTLKASSNIFSIFRSGMWLSTPYTSITSGTGWAADSIRAYPIAITKDVTFANIRAEVTTLIAGSNIRLGIATDSNGYPGTIVFDSGNISCASTGMKSAAVNMSFTASNRIIWLLLNMSVGTIGFRYASSTISYLGRPAAGGTTIGGLYRVASAFGAFPASYPAGAATEAHPLNGPLVEIEVA